MEYTFLSLYLGPNRELLTGQEAHQVGYQPPYWAVWQSSWPIRQEYKMVSDSYGSGNDDCKWCEEGATRILESVAKAESMIRGRRIREVYCGRKVGVTFSAKLV
jgi:hypothetical protein